MATTSSVPKSRPGALLKLMFKMPVYVYRLRLGWLLGLRFLMVSHRGRKTGKIRHTVLEVIRYDAASKESIAVSAYGESSSWYRNLQASPALEIRTGFDTYVPAQRFLKADQVYDELIDYLRRHPKAIRAITRLLGMRYDGSESQKQALAAHLRMVAFRPKGQV